MAHSLSIHYSGCWGRSYSESHSTKLLWVLFSSLHTLVWLWLRDRGDDAPEEKAEDVQHDG